MVSLLLGEVVVRLVAPQQPILIRPDIWQPHDGLGWVHAPHIDTRVNTGGGEIRLLTDAHGHRIGVDESRIEPELRVLALGDSYQAALQVENPQTFTELAEAGLEERLGQPVEIVNASVAGWGPSHYLIKARQELDRQPYDHVLVFFYLGNDVEPKFIEYFGPKKSTVRHAFRWPRRATRDEIVKGVLYPINDALETRSHLFLLFKNRLWTLLMRLNLSARRFPPVLLKSLESSDRWEVTADVCQRIDDTAKQRGIDVTFVLLPGICEVDLEIAEVTARATGIAVDAIDPDQPSRRMRRELEARGLEVIDLTPAMRAAHATGQPDLYGSVDVHFAAGGHQVVADQVTPHLLAHLRQQDAEESR